MRHASTAELREFAYVYGVFNASPVLQVLLELVVLPVAENRADGVFQILAGNALQVAYDERAHGVSVYVKGVAQRFLDGALDCRHVDTASLRGFLEWRRLVWDANLNAARDSR